MSTATFTITYCGPALDSNRMDVKELAPALLAFGSLLEESNRVLNGGSTAVTVKVKRFEAGSFGISFEVNQQLLAQMIQLFSGDHVTAASNLVQLLGFSSTAFYGLWRLVKKARGRTPKGGRKLQDGNIELDFGDERILIPDKVADLYRDVRVRKELENTIKPLERKGIERIEIKDGQNVIDYAEKEDISSFLVPEFQEETVAEDERIAMFSIVSLSFKEDNKWRLSDGTSSFYVTIHDEKFLRKVNENLIYFSKGDILKVRLVTRTWETMDGIRTEYNATEVLDHKSAARQLSFPFT